MGWGDSDLSLRVWPPTWGRASSRADDFGGRRVGGPERQQVSFSAVPRSLTADPSAEMSPATPAMLDAVGSAFAAVTAVVRVSAAERTAATGVGYCEDAVPRSALSELFISDSWVVTVSRPFSPSWASLMFSTEDFRASTSSQTAGWSLHELRPAATPTRQAAMAPALRRRLMRPG